MKKFHGLISLVIILITLTACSSSRKLQQSVSLDGEWNIIEIAGAQIQDAEEPPFIGFKLTEKRIYGSTGCNNMMGNLNLDAKNGKISFGNTASTRRLCPNMNVESAILSALCKVNQFKSLSKTQIKLEDQSGQQLMLLQKR